MAGELRIESFTMRSSTTLTRLDDDFSVIVTVCRGPCAQSIYKLTRLIGCPGYSVPLSSANVLFVFITHVLFYNKCSFWCGSISCLDSTDTCRR